MSTRPRPDAPDLGYQEAEAILRRLGKGWSEAADAPPHPAAPEPKVAPAQPAARPPAPAPLAPHVLQSLLEAVPDGLVVVDGTGRIVFVNAQTEGMFGYRRDELLGEPIEVLVPDRYRAGHVAKRDGFFAKGETRPMGQGLSLVGRRKDGREVPVEISLSPLRTEGGLLVVASVRDVSERRKAEARLRQLETRYRSLIEGIPAVTFMAAMDGETNELYVSPQIEKLLGFTAKEWLENPILWYTQLHPEDQSRWHDEFARTVASGEPFRSVYRFIARDGRTVWVQGEARIVGDEAGRPLFLQGMAFDITALKETQGELEAAKATLEKRVAERTAALEGKAAELERSNKVLGDFASVMAHDLRQPLRTMKSYIQKVAGRFAEVLDEQAGRDIRRVVNAGTGMEQLIKDLREFGKVGIEGKEPTPTDCRAALDAVRADLEADIREAGGEITAGELPVVLADATQLRQLFQNLIANSLKFRVENQPPRVHVSARCQGGQWVIAVADNGIGIDRPEALEKIFLLGTESQQHSRSRYAGSGIGLSTCEQIVQRHGGRIWAESAGANKGTTILFTLPASPG